MGRKLARSNQLKQFLKQFSRWGWGASVAVLIAGAGIMPAQADPLESWRYDSQARSLTLSLPPNVAPTLSVLAPNRLRVELPNTQVGEVAAQTVADGIVESIALEQATPDTVWMVVEFAEGVVLADVQSAVPTGTAEGLQQWQVRPALTSDGEDDALTADALTTAPSAIALSPADLAQIPDFPELPLLEPAIPLSEPVTVPPIDVRPDVQPINGPPIAPEPAEAAPVQAEAILSPADAAPTAEVIPADTAAADEAALPIDSVAAPPAADRSEEAIVVSEPEEFLFDPPFLEDTSEPSAADAAAIANVPADVPTATAAPVEAVVSIVEIPIVEIPAESVTPANTSRWPEPIPFGQPLP